MPTPYSFKEKEKDLDSLCKDLDNLDKKADSVLPRVSNARFDENKYGTAALEKKTSEIVKDAKKKIQRQYEKYVSSVSNLTYQSLKRIKGKAEEIKKSQEKRSLVLEQWRKLMESFKEGNYQNTITDCDRFDTSYFDDELIETLNHRKRESYEKEAEKIFPTASLSDYSFFVRYFVDAKTNEYILKSSCYLFLLSVRLLPIVKSFSKADICDSGRVAYQKLTKAEREKYKDDYQALYDKELMLFNKECEKAYKGFDYPRRKQLRNRVTRLNPEDFTLEFYRQKKTDPDKLFDYLKNYSSKVMEKTKKAVFMDTRSLFNGNRKDEYLTYWFLQFDEDGFQYVDVLIDGKENELSCYPLLIETCRENKDQIKDCGNCFLKLTEKYCTALERSKKQINLYLFLNTSILWNNCIKTLKTKNPTNLDYQGMIASGARNIDNRIFPRINRYRNLCSGYNQDRISKLNVVLKDTAGRLFLSSELRLLKRNPKKYTNQNECVSLVTTWSEGSRKKRTSVFITIAFIVVIIVLIIVLVKACR